MCSSVITVIVIQAGFNSANGTPMLDAAIMNDPNVTPPVPNFQSSFTQVCPIA